MADEFIIKICGIKDAQTLDYAIKHGANMVGLNHFPKSPRYVDLQTLAKLIDQSKGKTASVVLLVNPEWEQVQAIAALKPDFIQLHGTESPEFVVQIIDELQQKIIKALPVGSTDDLTPIANFVQAGATILLDAKPPKNATRPGGLGKVFDWKILDALEGEIDFILSGGLNVDNVAMALKSTNATGVDVSSGVENAPGQKDLAKIKLFIANATNALAS